MLTRFNNYKFISSKLIEYGFIKQDKFYIIKKSICNDYFDLIIKIINQVEISIKVIEIETEDEYVLYKVPQHSGSFAGLMRLEIEDILDDIKEKCCLPFIFKSEQAQEVIEYIKSKYNSELEFLWKKFPDNAVFRRKDNNKWYGAILKVSKNKLDNNGDNSKIEILDLRGDITKIDNNNIYPGYHMNKNNWITIILDNRIPTQEIINLIDISYSLAIK